MQPQGDSPDGAEPQPEGKRRQYTSNWFLRVVVEFLIALAIAVTLTWLVTTFILQPYEVPSGSMEPTIMTGDKIIAEKLSFVFGPIKRGDIIVFEDKTHPGRILVKRVIAVAGETVDLRNGSVVVDSNMLYEPYTYRTFSNPLPSSFDDMPIEYPYVVPEGCVWVMGDNRDNSADSRYFGPIEERTVEGRVMMVFWPPSDISILM